MLSDWEGVACTVEVAEERFKIESFGRLFVRELERQKSVVQHSGSLSQASSASSGSKKMPSLFSFRKLALDEEAGSNQKSGDRDAMIEKLIRDGRMLMDKGVFALPSLRWRRDESADPEEKRVLNTVGFLLDAYDKRIW